MATRRELERFWKRFGVGRSTAYEQGLGYIKVYPHLSLDNLFQLAIPRICDKPEIRFRQGYPFMNTLHCLVLTHLPSGCTQSYESHVKSRAFCEKSCAEALYKTIRRADILGGKHANT